MDEDASVSAINVVVVDDDTVTLELVRRKLRGANIRLKCFSDSEAALEFLAEHTPATLLIDQRMPFLSGIEILQQLSINDRVAANRVYLCSAGEMPERISAVAEALGAVTLTKDVYSSKELLLELLMEGPSLNG